MYSLLSLCIYIMFLKILYCFFPFLNLFLSGISKFEWMMIPTCPSLTCCFNKGSIEGTKSSNKFVSDLCMYFKNILYGLIVWI